jgi:transcription antitermination factor NusG
MSKDKPKPKAKPAAVKVGDSVKITAGPYVDRLGKVKHIRWLTGEAHIDMADGTGMVYAKTSTLEAA